MDTNKQKTNEAELTEQELESIVAGGTSGGGPIQNRIVGEV